MLHRLTFMAAIILTGNSAAAANKYNTIQIHKYKNIQIHKYKYKLKCLAAMILTRNSAADSEIQWQQKYKCMNSFIKEIQLNYV